jgi:AraC-like DNA-binding protein
MIEKKPFLDCNLSLTELAESLGIFNHYLTQVLNDELNQNFYDFINSYRIEEFKKLLLDKKYNRYTLYAIALEAGFNSKSTFNRIFKNFTGLTPSQYKNTL